MTPRPPRIGRPSVVALVLGLLLTASPILGAVHPAQAAQTFVVNRATDEPDRNLADAACDVSANAGPQCTLRAAIQEANATPGADTIAFAIPNDPNDPDAGANNRQNFPEILTASSSQVVVTLNSVPNQNFFIRLYSNPDGDEGISYDGTFAVSTDATSNTGLQSMTPNPPIPAGRTATTTATRGNGDTSEFSDPEPVAA